LPASAITSAAQEHSSALVHSVVSVYSSPSSAQSASVLALHTRHTAERSTVGTCGRRTLYWLLYDGEVSDLERLHKVGLRHVVFVACNQEPVRLAAWQAPADSIKCQAAGQLVCTMPSQ
jgi:hypothetical protein